MKLTLDSDPALLLMQVGPVLVRAENGLNPDMYKALIQTLPVT